jgi:hypothetical protein
MSHNQDTQMGRPGCWDQWLSDVAENIEIPKVLVVVANTNSVAMAVFSVHDYGYVGQITKIPAPRTTIYHVEVLRFYVI